MDKKTQNSGLSLSALVFCLGAGHAATAANVDPMKLQALELLNENRISPEEFRQLVTDSDLVTDGNYASLITDGNYANLLTDANYADLVTSGNYADLETDGNYGSDYKRAMQEGTLPAPKVKNK